MSTTQKPLTKAEKREYAKMRDEYSQRGLNWVWRAIDHSGKTPTQIAYKGGPVQQTLRNWESGKTRNPQFSTIYATLKACGFSLELKQK